MRVENEPHRWGEGRTAGVIGQPANLHRRAAANRQIEDLLRDLRHPFENRAAAGEDDARVERLLVTRAADLIPGEMKDLLGARLQNLGEDAPRHQARLWG